jgi:hypothetical protein
VPAKQPHFASAANRVGDNFRHVIARILLRIDQNRHQGIDLGGFKAGYVYVQVVFGKQIGEFAQFGG